MRKNASISQFFRSQSLLPQNISVAFLPSRSPTKVDFLKKFSMKKIFTVVTWMNWPNMWSHKTKPQAQSHCDTYCQRGADKIDNKYNWIFFTKRSIFGVVKIQVSGFEEKWVWMKIDKITTRRGLLSFVAQQNFEVWKKAIFISIEFYRIKLVLINLDGKNQGSCLGEVWVSKSKSVYSNRNVCLFRPI